MGEAVHDFSFDIGNQSITVKDVAFPEVKLDVTAAEFVTQSFTSLECKEIEFN